MDIKEKNALIVKAVKNYFEFREVFVQFRNICNNLQKDNLWRLKFEDEESDEEMVIRFVTFDRCTILGEFSMALDKKGVPFGRITFTRYPKDREGELIWKFYFDKQGSFIEKLPVDDIPYSILDEECLTPVLTNLLYNYLKLPCFQIS
jgi:hypothetical protein